MNEIIKIKENHEHYNFESKYMYEKFFIFILSILFYSEGILWNFKIINVQTFPLIIIFSIIFFFYFYQKIYLNIKIIYFFIFIIFYLIFFSFIYLYKNNFNFLNIFFRNIVSLFCGFLIFLFFIYFFSYYSFNYIKFFIFSGFLICFLFSLSEFIFKITRFYNRSSAYFLFSEPSHLAYYISTIIFPFIILNKEKLKKKYYYILILLILINLTLTFSLTGFFAFFVILFINIFFNNKKKLLFLIFNNFLIFMVLTILFYLIFFILYPDNYLRIMLTDLMNRILDKNNVSEIKSFSDRLQFFYIFPNIFNNIDNLEKLYKFIFGFGIGGEVAYLNEIFPQSLSYITSIKSGGYLTSFQSKLFVWGGLLLSFFVNSAWIILIKFIYIKNNKLAGVLLGVWIVSFVTLGALTMPIIWFWIAYSLVYLKKVKNEQQKS